MEAAPHHDPSASFLYITDKGKSKVNLFVKCKQQAMSFHDIYTFQSRVATHSFSYHYMATLVLFEDERNPLLFLQTFPVLHNRLTASAWVVLHVQFVAM